MFAEALRIVYKNIELNKRLEILAKELEQKKKQIRYYKKEKKRLEELVDKLHADCFYYENHRIPKPWEEQEESKEFPF